jgi:hypothetical protein
MIFDSGVQLHEDLPRLIARAEIHLWQISGFAAAQAPWLRGVITARPRVGANVQVEVSSGTHTFTFRTGPKPTDLVHTGSLPGTGIDLTGATHTITQGGEHIRAFVFLPLGPTIAGPGFAGSRNWSESGHLAP